MNLLRAVGVRRSWGAFLSLSACAVACLALAAGGGCDRSPKPPAIQFQPVETANQAAAVTDRSPRVDAPVPVQPTPGNSPATTINFRDATGETGIAFRHTDGNCNKFYVVEAAASGLATFDFDHDGLMDIYFLSGEPLPGTGPDAPPGGNALYRNLGGLRFADVTAQAGVGKTGYGLAVAVADYDNDGWQDIYVSNFGPKVLYRNRGDGTFENVSAAAGVSDGDQFGAGVSFLDIESDGDLDLYVANYTELTFDNHVVKTNLGVPVYGGPLDYHAIPHSLFRNRGDGTFEDFSEGSGIRAHPGLGMGTICADYDDDGAVDIFVANDESPNFLFHNDGHGRFTEVANRAGVAFNANGRWVGNMGVDCADYDHDGRLDFFITTFQREIPLLFKNVGGGFFEDIAVRAAQTQRCYNNSKWGCGFADFDNDGHKDLFVGIGHLQVNIEQYDKTSAYAATPMLLWNNGKGKFLDVTDSCGEGLKVMCVARGVALEDFDNDGNIDVVISNSRRPPWCCATRPQTQITGSRCSCAASKPIATPSAPD